jgi:predicted transcriptional regulator
MKGTVTIRVDRALDEALSLAAERSGRTRSEVVRDALRRQLALRRFDELREMVLPFAERQDLITDEDVFSAVS